MKRQFFYFKMLLISMLLVVVAFSGCGSSANGSNMNQNESGENNQKQESQSEVATKSLSEQIDELLKKESITKKDLKAAYTLVKELEKEDKAQAQNYIMEMKYCMYDYDPYGLEDGYTVWATSLENAKEQLSCFYGTWYENGTDKVINFTAAGINERPYYVYSMYSDFATMLIFGYLDEPEKLYCMAAESEYYEDIYGNGENVYSISFYSDYVPGLEKENDNTFWCEYDSASFNDIMNDWNEYLQEETYGTSSLLIYEELINNTVIPSYDGADTTEIQGDGHYFDEIVSKAWFDEYGQPIARFMPTELTELLFFEGYYAFLENLHFVDGSDVTLDYVKRYGYSTDVFSDEIYAILVTDIQKVNDDNGAYMYGREYFSGEYVIIVGEFNGILNGDNLMVLGPLLGLGSDDTANFTGVYAEIINDRL